MTKGPEQSNKAEGFAPEIIPGQKIYPPRRHRRWLWLLVIGGAILVLLTVFIGLGSVHTLSQQTFHVTTEPQLVINDTVGSISLQSGSSDRVQVSVIEHTSLWSNLPHLRYSMTQSGNTIQVELTASTSAPVNFGEVDLEVTLPSQSDIQATLQAGSITIAGVSGVMNIQADAGSIDFTNGQIKASSSFRASAGSITFTGLLEPGGDDTFATNAGSIDVTLPASSAFLLDASTGAGNVNNAFGANTVGNAPRSQLHIHTNAGSVNISQG